MKMIKSSSTSKSKKLWRHLQPGDDAPRILDIPGIEISAPCARSYDIISTASRAHAEKIRDIAKLVMESSAENILDLGCGSGVLEKNLLDRGFRGSIIAVDRSEEMLRIAKSKTQRNLKISYELFDLEQKLPFQKERFDCVTCINVIFMLRRPAAFISEVYRVLKPNGSLFLVSPKPEGDIVTLIKAQFSEKSSKGLIKELFSILRLSGAIFKQALFQKKLDKFHKKGLIHYPTADELRNLIQNTGFVIDEIVDIQAKQNWLVKARRLH